jgi:hypothetical protein
MGEHSDFWIAPFQRAKVIRVNDCHWLLGRELWVKVGAPERVPVRDIESKREVYDAPTYITHLFDDQGYPIRSGADQLELLARDERDFVSFVECEYWKTWRDQPC